MKTALVLGVSGGFGKHMAMALLQQDWHVQVLLRDSKKLPKELQGRVRVYEGNAFNHEDVKLASKGCAALVYGINVPYERWQQEAIPLLNVSLEVAKQETMTFLFPGNVYVYDPQQGPSFLEGSPKKSITVKGDIRIQMEALLADAAQNGLKVLLIRAGDFFGKDLASSWMNFILKANPKHYTLTVPGPMQMPHTWAYLPELAQQACGLLEQDNWPGNYHEVHFEGHRFSFDDLKNVIEKRTGKPVKVRKLPWWLFNILGFFKADIRELVAMKYLWFNEINLETGHQPMTGSNRNNQSELIDSLLESGLV